jgi:2-dehydro-3-deoxygluconokinase
MTMGTAIDVVSLGEPLYEFSQIPGEDRKYLQGFGGDTSNASIAAARQGARVAYVTRLGDDEFGRRFLALWCAEGLDTSGVGTDREGHTAVYFIHYGPQGHEFSYLRAGSAASRMRPAHLPLDLIRAAKFFHTSHLTPSALRLATVSSRPSMQRSPAQGSLRFESSARAWPVPGKAVIAATIPLADYFASLDDVKVLSGLSSPTRSWIEPSARSRSHGARSAPTGVGERRQARASAFRRMQ